jgi:hypothetical protein
MLHSICTAMQEAPVGIPIAAIFQFLLELRVNHKE